MAAEDKTNNSPDKVQSILAQRNAMSMLLAVEKKSAVEQETGTVLTSNFPKRPLQQPTVAE
jgi:hypothetical protein